MNDNTKIKLFLDADDTILQSSETIIKMLNEKYNINPPKTVEDIGDWGYRSIYKNLSSAEVDQLYESDIFFNDVAINPVFWDFYTKYRDQLDISVVTKGTRVNIEKKKKYLDEAFNNQYTYYGIVLVKDEFNRVIRNYDKSKIDMSGGIQIDDRADCLENTNAAVKILIRNGERYWNKPILCANMPNNVYIVNNWNEAIEIILFMYNNPTLFE